MEAKTSAIERKLLNRNRCKLQLQKWITITKKGMLSLIYVRTSRFSKEISVSEDIYAENARQSGHMFASASDRFGPKMDIYNLKTVILAILTNINMERMEK